MAITVNPWHWLRGGFHPAGAHIARWRSKARHIVALSKQLDSLSDDELLKRGRELRWQARAGTPLRKLLPQAYALVRQSSRRTLEMEHFPVQLMGGIALFEGNIAEMQTGEGKTLTATLPVYLRALTGQGVHVITVNDYLAGRDADIMGPIYRKLGLTVGKILDSMETDERRENYACDVVYGTAKEMGFDFLRDRLRRGAAGVDDDQPERVHSTIGGGELPVQRGHHFALIDEADSILIDEARTPLIIGLTQPNDPATVNLFRWSHRATFHLDAATDYVYEPDRRSAYLTDQGCRKVVLMSKPSLLNSMDTERIYSQVEKALIAKHGFILDRDYVVVDDKVCIVDESTGRIMDGRKWQDGLHQAVEAKELVPITAATGQAARVTVQSFFRQYRHLAGMTGTAVPARGELRKVYRLSVSRIPTNKRCIRKSRGIRIYTSQEKKRDAIVEEIQEVLGHGRAVLVGTPSVDASEALAKLLSENGVEHQTLNALYHEMEAEIVKRAGAAGRVTIATNMAGRGTDIILDDDVKVSGGLHVIATEMHSSKRIDRQLIGRAARQGDPGTYKFFLSLEDELLRTLDQRKVQRKQRSARGNRRGQVASGWLRFFRRTQRSIEKNHRKQRKHLLKQEKIRSENYERMGLDPFLELTES